MRKHRFVVSVAIVCVCMLVLSGIAVADSPLSPAVTPSPTVSQGQEPPLPPLQRGQPQAANASQAIQDLGLTQFQNIYAAEITKSDGSDEILLGPGDDTAFVNALHALLDSSTIKALGPEPEITIVRVPHSYADFTAASNALGNAIQRLIAAGFQPTISKPDYLAGTYDVELTSAPKGISAVEATAYLRKTVSPLIRVISVDAPQVKELDDRGHNPPPFLAGALIRNTGSGAFCTAGFAVIGTLN